MARLCAVLLALALLVSGCATAEERQGQPASGDKTPPRGTGGY